MLAVGSCALGSRITGWRSLIGGVALCCVSTAVALGQPSSIVPVAAPAFSPGAGTTKDRNPKCLESFVAIIDADVLVGMATANTVEAQLGPTEFKLGPMEQLSLRRFAENVNLLAPLPKAAAAALDNALAAGPMR